MSKKQTGSNSEEKKNPAIRAKKNATQPPVADEACNPCGPTANGKDHTAKSTKSTKAAARGVTANRGSPRQVDGSADKSKAKASRWTDKPEERRPTSEEIGPKSEKQTGETSDVKKITVPKATRAKKSEELQPVTGNTGDLNGTGNDEKPKSSKDTKVTRCSSTKGSRLDENPGKILQDVLDDLTVRKNAKSEAARRVNDISDKVVENLKNNLDWCEKLNVLRTGSYYEHVKIQEPDEFDVMLTVDVDRVDLRPFSEDGAFYSVGLKRDPRSKLKKFVNDDGTIKASEMLLEFRDQVKKAVKDLPDVSLPRKKKGCPAVTLNVNNNNNEISIDFVLGLAVKGSRWPDCTQEGFKVEKWLGKEEKRKQQQKEFYLVPKYEGRGSVEQDGVSARDAWRISFSHVEKYILKKHGNTKTCCDKGQKCCRKQCLKLLKYLLQRLKEQYPEEAGKLYSYHAKTALLHACAARVDDREWAVSELIHCFQQLLEDFEKYLRDRQLPNFFIPSQNLLGELSQNKKSCEFLANHIRHELTNGFPLLRETQP